LRLIQQVTNEVSIKIKALIQVVKEQLVELPSFSMFSTLQS
jgi:hypothetical protein